MPNLSARANLSQKGTSEFLQLSMMGLVIVQLFPEPQDQRKLNDLLEINVVPLR